MKKRRRHAGLTAPSPATPAMQMKWSAESMADTALRSHPKIQAARNAIMHEVMAATEHALSKTLKSGTAKKKR